MLPGKRKREDEDIYSSYKRLKSQPPLLTSGRSFRGYRRSSRRSTSSASYRPKYRYRYKPPYTRGPAASVNRVHPELKSILTDVKFLPVSFGNGGSGGSSYPHIPTYQWAGAITSPFTNWDGTNISGVLIPLNAIPTGGNLAQRIGRTVYMKSVLLQATWRYNPDAATTTPASIRTMLVWDKQPNNNLPVLSDILEPVAYPGPSTFAMPTSPNNLSFRDRFRTLWDCHDTLNPQGDALREYDKYISLGSLQTVFPNNAVNDGTITSGALYLILLSDQVNDERPWCRITARARFTDQ